jgi:3-oxoacyl-[acyl-carrier protein] reductase
MIAVEQRSQRGETIVSGLCEGRVAIVTGAGRGIGREHALMLAAEGAKVVVNDLGGSASGEGTDAGPAQQVVDEIVAAGGEAVANTEDISDWAGAERIVAQAVETFGGLHVLVNNAGVTKDNMLFKMTEEDWDTCVDISLKGSFLMAQAAQKHMVAAKYGKIVNLSSISALGNRGQSNYSAAKAGIQGLTATMAIELGPFNVNVNAVAPGFVQTPMTEATAGRMGITVEEFVNGAAATHPLRRVAQPEDIAAVIAFLASEDARHVTGQTIYVNGGKFTV